MISTQLLKTLREEINAALETVGMKHGVLLRVENGSYSSTEFNFKLNGREMGESGTAKLSSGEKMMIVAEINHPSVTEENVEGFTFTDRKSGRTMTITGYNAKAPKFCIKLIDNMGQGSRAPGGYVRQNLSVSQFQTR